MNTAANPPNDTKWRMSKNVLNAGELNGSLTLIGPGSELEPETSSVERVIYVAQGVITAAFSAANHILQTDDTLVVPAGRSLEIRNSGNAPAKVLVMSLPSRRRAETPLVVLN
ncbi:cupin domain-containing protein [Nibricoccus aquaticus]|nr:cupin domain-containing protein [Nibricoccus aquaticus]